MTRMKNFEFKLYIHCCDILSATEQKSLNSAIFTQNKLFQNTISWLVNKTRTLQFQSFLSGM